MSDKRWVPLDERYPEMNPVAGSLWEISAPLIITYFDGVTRTVMDAICTKMTYSDGSVKYCWYHDTVLLESIRVIAWQLPEPYMGDIDHRLKNEEAEEE